MKSWLSNFSWAFRRSNNQLNQHSSDEGHAIPGGTRSSLNADVSSSGGDHESGLRNNDLEALTPSKIEEGVVFAKNNVSLRVSDSAASPKHKGNKKGEDHVNNSGYFYMRAQEISFHGNTYIVHWLANSEIKKAATGEPSKEPASALNNNNNAISIELNTLEMIRFFYDSEAGASDCTLSNGQMVLSNKDGVIHIFRFGSGGLQRLVDLLRGCKFLRETSQEMMEQDNQKQVMFVVYTPKLGLKEMHPAEHEIQTQLNRETWDDLHDREGRITALKLIQKIVFFRGIAYDVRKEVWPFLLGIFSWKSTTQERLQFVESLSEDYKKVHAKREGLKEEAEEAYEQAKILIERDVVRTRCNFSDNKVQQNTDLLRSVLLAYVLYDPMVSYTQGMTDLLAPLLVSLEDEVMSFWCFTKLVERSIFFKPSSVSISMESQLELLRPLTELLLPEFYNYLKGIYHGLDFLFCHRWLLVCFKREFVIEDALLIWEACWINYETSYFHLFLCIAIMAMYGIKAVEKSLGLEELTVHFNTLSCMPANIVLSQARGFLYQLTQLKQVPCVLKYIINDSETWDRPGRPKLVCICNSRTGVCAKDALEISTFC